MPSLPARRSTGQLAELKPGSTFPTMAQDESKTELSALTFMSFSLYISRFGPNTSSVELPCSDIDFTTTVTACAPLPASKSSLLGSAEVRICSFCPSSTLSPSNTTATSDRLYPEASSMSLT